MLDLWVHASASKSRTHNRNRPTAVKLKNITHNSSHHVPTSSVVITHNARGDRRFFATRLDVQQANFLGLVCGIFQSKSRHALNYYLKVYSRVLSSVVFFSRSMIKHTVLRTEREEQSRKANESTETKKRMLFFAAWELSDDSRVPHTYQQLITLRLSCLFFFFFSESKQVFNIFFLFQFDIFHSWERRWWWCCCADEWGTELSIDSKLDDLFRVCGWRQSTLQIIIFVINVFFFYWVWDAT